ncbi:hypothetical protein TNCV_2908501 [Trichonephila clavipes]|nr:hypothetical protein TNCV_2908501 [Trichonephila clavipes]
MTSRHHLTEELRCQGQPRATTNADDRYLSLRARRNRTAISAELGTFLQALKGWCQGQPCVKVFMNVVFRRDDQPFASRSRHAIGRRVCSGTSTCPLDASSMDGFSLYG